LFDPKYSSKAGTADFTQIGGILIDLIKNPLAG
jgi:hypothetical protein